MVGQTKEAVSFIFLLSLFFVPWLTTRGYYHFLFQAALPTTSAKYLEGVKRDRNNSNYHSFDTGST